jgi:hypothetical protein
MINMSEQQCVTGILYNSQLKCSLLASKLRAKAKLKQFLLSITLTYREPIKGNEKVLQSDQIFKIGNGWKYPFW